MCLSNFEWRMINKNSSNTFLIRDHPCKINNLWRQLISLALYHLRPTSAVCLASFNYERVDWRWYLVIFVCAQSLQQYLTLDEHRELSSFMSASCCPPSGVSAILWCALLQYWFRCASPPSHVVDHYFYCCCCNSCQLSFTQVPALPCVR